MSNLTPLIQQYLTVKEKYPEAILFYRLGDFYEMFFDDAKLASQILGITLTSRDKNKEDAVPMCGVPYHAASSYIQKLVDQGYKVAICEQMEEAGKGRGIVHREVVRVITPGMVLEDEFLQPKDNNFLMAMVMTPEKFGLAFLDASTGDFLATEVKTAQSLIDEVIRLRPREIILPEGMKNKYPFKELRKSFPSALYTPLPDEVFSVANCQNFWKSIDEKKEALCAAGALIFYVQETQKTAPNHLAQLEFYQTDDYMILDETTRRHLELFENSQTRSRQGTLIDILDETMTPMGGRLLKRWLSFPLLDLAKIKKRQAAVAELKEKDLLRHQIRELLSQMRDLERLAARISLEIANARDLVALRSSLDLLPQIKAALAKLGEETLQKHYSQIDEMAELRDLLHKAIEDNPPVSLKEGGLIKKGFDGQLDHLREISSQGKKWIAELEAKERLRTGISSLKVRYNKVFGYYIEVTKPNLSLVPGHYIRKQTLANAERYITPELQEYEEQVLSAEEKKDALEYEIFKQILRNTAQQVGKLQKIAQALAEVDVFQSFAEVAEKGNYCCPTLDESLILKIGEGRHPVLERVARDEPFVPNDLYMDDENSQILIITGPNMAGKSTLLRQTALIVILAQVGSFVPAREAHLGVVDRIFTRIGATDDLTRGRSTFMVEMEEVAHILKNITSRSLILLDEIGRGTSTFDGLSIAWAVTEFLHDDVPCRPKALFATHYHELTELALTKPRIKNFHVAVKEWNERIIFLRKLIPGGTSRSYGIQVARLAGLPEVVIERAKEILNNLEQGEFTEGGIPKLALSRKKKITWDSLQMPLFQNPPDPIREMLKKIDPNCLTPLEALNLLNELKKRLSN